jgi:hypothetical protein
MLYYHVNHAQIVPKKTNPKMARGACVHKILDKAFRSQFDYKQDPDKAIAIGLKSCASDLSDLPLDQKNMATDMAMDIWDKIKLLDVIASEKVFDYHFEHDSHPFVWKIKPDNIIKESGKYYQGEYKTTEGYGPATQKFYHKGIQLWLYLKVLLILEEYTPFEGVQLFVATPAPKSPQGLAKWQGCAIETISKNDTSLEVAHRYILDSATKVLDIETRIDKGGTDLLLRNRNECTSFRGGECAYPLLCDPKVKVGSPYYDSVVNSLFKHQHPTSHLMEE